jgi:hypothetical protein
MRLPRPRFTVRRLMVAVAVVGMVLGSGVEVVRRWLLFRERAAQHAQLVMRGMCNNPMTGTTVPDFTPAEIEALRQSEYHRRLYLKYRDAASYPWLPVAPDPPEPE